MRRLLPTLALLLAVPAVQAQQLAEDRGLNNTGIGIIVGEPTGLTARFGPHVQAHAAWSFSGSDDAFQLSVDYLFLRGAFPDAPGLGWYFGVGGHGKFASDFVLGARGPLGLSYRLKPPIELFAEVVPIFTLAPDTDFDIQGGIGFRVLFR